MSSPSSTVVKSLEKLDVPFEIIEIDPAFAATATFCERYRFPLEKSANTIVVASKRGPKKHAACVVLATQRLDVNKTVRKLMEVSRASFASSNEMKELTGMEVGGVTPISLPREIPLYVDKRVMVCDWIILGGGGKDLKIKISPDIFLKLGATIVPDLGMEQIKS